MCKITPLTGLAGCWLAIRSKNSLCNVGRAGLGGRQKKKLVTRNISGRMIIDQVHRQKAENI